MAPWDHPLDPPRLMHTALRLRATYSQSSDIWLLIKLHKQPSTNLVMVVRLDYQHTQYMCCTELILASLNRVHCMAVGVGEAGEA